MIVANKKVASMRLKVSLLIPLSIVLGLGAVQTGRTWLDRQMNDRMRALEASRGTSAPVTAAPVAMQTIVVAARPLRFGDELVASAVKTIPWPADQLPAGAFSTVAAMTKDGSRPVALSAIEMNEPVLQTKITGPGQKANLAAVIEKDMKAVTVRVDDVVGVAGFVLPGDRVDVLLTRRTGDNDAFADNILQNLRVLAIDQKADDRLNGPTVARAVTLEVTTEQAQILSVGQRVGQLTLVLRPVGSNGADAHRRITSTQLGAAMPAAPSAPNAPKPMVSERGGTVTVNVIRPGEAKEYSVPGRR